jgi:hypothetical protein
MNMFNSGNNPEKMNYAQHKRKPTFDRLLCWQADK